MPLDFAIPNLFAYLIAVIHALGMLAAVHAVLTVRTAQGALAWAMSLFFMPYLTLLPYLVFGRSRFDAYIKARRHADKQMHQAMAELNWRPWVEEALSASAAPVYQQLRALPQLGRMPCLANNQVQLLSDGEAAFAAIFSALASARKVILLQFFIIRDDRLGQRLQDLLLERAAAGVQVFVLYDGVGSHALPRHFSEKMRAGGIQVHAFTTGGGLLSRFQLNFRNHRKIVVVDGCVAFTGGINITDEENEAVNPEAFHDLHMRLEGSIVRWLQLAFLEDWHYATGTALRDEKLWPEAREGTMLAHALPSGPDSVWEAIHRVKVEAIHQADKRVWLVTPYFVPGEAAMTEAARSMS